MKTCHISKSLNQWSYSWDIASHAQGGGATYLHQASYEWCGVSTVLVLLQVGSVGQ